MTTSVRSYVLQALVAATSAAALWSFPAAATNLQGTAARTAIDRGNQQYLSALRAGDARAFAALYAVDGIQMPSSGRPIVRGRTAIEQQTADGFKTTTYTGGSIVTTNVAVFGSNAYETGRYSFTYQEKRKQPMTVTGRYFEVWEHQPSGAYLIKVDSGFPAACP
jgi:uncharacterized protein (TIGR02246 family)